MPTSPVFFLLHRQEAQATIQLADGDLDTAASAWASLIGQLSDGEEEDEAAGAVGDMKATQECKAQAHITEVRELFILQKQTFWY